MVTEYPEKPPHYYLVNNSDNTLLTTLLIKIEFLQQLNVALNNTVEPPLNQHCKVANFRQNVLVLEVDSSAWATRLHFSIPALLKQLQQGNLFQQLEKIEYYINPTSLSPKITVPFRKLQLSSNNAQLLTDTAKHMPSKNLQHALLKLARHSVK